MAPILKKFEVDLNNNQPNPNQTNNSNNISPNLNFIDENVRNSINRNSINSSNTINNNAQRLNLSQGVRVSTNNSQLSQLIRRPSNAEISRIQVVDYNVAIQNQNLNNVRSSQSLGPQGATVVDSANSSN